MRAVFVFPPAWAPWAPSYAMGLLSAAAKRRGHEFIGLDMNIEVHNAVAVPHREWWLDHNVLGWCNNSILDELWTRYPALLDGLVAQVVSAGAPLCAFSVTSASSNFARRMAKMIKQRSPSMTILFGGPHCFRSEAGLDLLADPAIDAICTGEGDLVWPDFLDAFEENGFRLRDVRGICYKRPDGQIVDCGDPELVTDLDSVPYADYSSVDLRKYSIQNRLCLMMSRGCINRCAFCSEGPNFKKYRCRSAANLFEEVRRSVNWLRKSSDARPHINFSDSLINGRPEILEAFCDQVIREDISFTWGGMALFRKEMTRGLLAKMKQAGFVEVMWGLESGCNETLRLMNKRTFTVEMAEEIIRNASELGIDQCANIIVGFPGETETMFLETLEFVRRNLHYFRALGLPLLEIRRNSRVHDKYQEYGIESPETTMWQTTDHVNTFPLRMARRSLLEAVVEKKHFDQGRYKDPPPAPAEKKVA